MSEVYVCTWLFNGQYQNSKGKQKRLASTQSSVITVIGKYRNQYCNSRITDVGLSPSAKYFNNGNPRTESSLEDTFLSCL